MAFHKDHSTSMVILQLIDTISTASNGFITKKQ